MRHGKSGIDDPVKFVETSLAGVFLVESETIEDDRGFFTRSWCEREFHAAGLDARVAQANISFNCRAGTVRGMHFQGEPHAESKLVRCTRGAIFDVVVDLRPASPTYCQWYGASLAADKHNAMYVPVDCAHGLQTMVDDSEVHYLMSEFYDPEAASGVRYDDPAFGIDWPRPVTAIAEKDTNWPLWRQ